MTLRSLLIVTLATICLFNSASALRDNFLAPANTSCACSGEVLTFVCATVGPGSTIWRGTAFDCTGQINEITLRHSEFSSPTGTSGSCNNGAIVGQSIGVDNNCYTSQLSITIQTPFNNKTVQCVYSSDTVNIIGQSLLSVVSNSASNLYPPPNDVSLIEIDEGQVTFNWTSVSSSCPTIDYVIISDCGVCPSSTSTTTVTCSDLQLPTQSDDFVCSFNVSSRVCGIVGNKSSSILAVPSAPRVLLIPQYSNESKTVKNISVNIIVSDTHVIKSDISGSVTGYIVTYSILNTMVNMYIPAESLSCEVSVTESDCSFITVAVPAFVCSSSTVIDVTISAVNRIGQGPSSDKVAIGCTNTFVQVNLELTTSLFTCEFFNKLDNSRSIKSCSIVYGLCNRELTNQVQGYSTLENPDVVSLVLDLAEDENNMYCYIVTAGSNTTIKIKGNFTEGDQEYEAQSNIAMISAVVISVLFIITLCICLVVVFIVTLQVQGREYRVTYSKIQAIPGDLKLKPIAKDRFKVYKVCKPGELREFIKKKEPDVRSWKGCVFYELTDEKEDITDDKELILQSMKDSEKLFTLKNDKEELHKYGLLGEGISKPTSQTWKYKVFVQSKGSGARHLGANTSVLFEKKDFQDRQLLPVPKDYFVIKTIIDNMDKDGCSSTTIQDLGKKLDPCIKKWNMFLERIDKPKMQIGDIHDVILMDKETQNLFTGPYAKKELDNPECEKKWRVFVLLKKRTDTKIMLKAGMMVIHENPVKITETFTLLKVKEDNVRMSTFVKKRCNAQKFESGRAFFQFTQEEDFPCCRKMIELNKKYEMEDDSRVVLDASVQTFYDTLREAPGAKISPPQDCKAFIHCLSQGSRCLKKDTFVLYKINIEESCEVELHKLAMDNGNGSKEGCNQVEGRSTTPAKENIIQSEQSIQLEVDTEEMVDLKHPETNISSESAESKV